MKRLLKVRQEYDENLSGHDVNDMISDTVKDAYDKLEPENKLWIEGMALRLTGKIKKLSYNGALELLAAIGNLDLEVK
jgi:hypothetical protein